MAARSVRIQAAAAGRREERSAWASVVESHSWQACSWEDIMVEGGSAAVGDKQSRAES